MAETKLRERAVIEKLNSMAVDLIDVTVAADADNQGSQAAGDLLFKVTEIPNAVAVNGGTAILQSCCIIIGSGSSLTGPIDFVITSSSTALTESSDGSAAETGDAVAGFDNTLAELDGTCGFFGISNAFDAGVVAIGDKKNIGMVCKAEAGSKSLYVYGIQQSAADYLGSSSIVLRLGFVKD
jgi:hypothetical protein